MSRRSRNAGFPGRSSGFGAGIATYFGLGNEPPLAAAAVAAGAGLACIAGPPEHFLGSEQLSCCLLTAIGAVWFCRCTVPYTNCRGARDLRQTWARCGVTGRIEDVDIRAPDRARLVIAVSRIEGLQAPPAYVRLTISGAKAAWRGAKPGAVLSALAMLRPPPEPAMPHGYDFRALGLVSRHGRSWLHHMARRELLSAPSPGVLERLNSRLDELRLSMTGRIERAIPGPDGSVAAALITGERGEIDPDDNQAYRDSGLAHVLSISGVHLALAGLGVFWVFRALLAFWPRVALTQPIKKWAAARRFLRSTFYLAISGGGSPAVRSC